MQHAFVRLLVELARLVFFRRVRELADKASAFGFERYLTISVGFLFDGLGVAIENRDVGILEWFAIP